MKTKLLAGTIASYAALAGAAWADQPKPWEMRFQDAATGIMAQITSFEIYTLWFIIPITLFVLALLVYVMFQPQHHH